MDLEIETLELDFNSLSLDNNNDLSIIENQNKENENLKKDNKDLKNIIESQKKELIKLTNIIKNLKSTIGRNTAINGYNEEVFICKELNNNKKLIEMVKEFTNEKYLEKFNKIDGTTKTDISNNKINFQIKKYKDKQFGQLDRHWVHDLVLRIPALKDIEKKLKNLCELPLKPCGKLCDREKQIIKLNSDNYTKEELSNLTDILNKNKKEILEFAFLGYNKKFKPNYICGVKHKNNRRDKLTIYKISDVIDSLLKNNFKIRKSSTVIELGPLTMQRKGGDGGKKGANQLQIKLVFSKLEINTKLEYTY